MLLFSSLEKDFVLFFSLINKIIKQLIKAIRTMMIDNKIALVNLLFFLISLLTNKISESMIILINILQLFY